MVWLPTTNETCIMVFDRALDVSTLKVPFESRSKTPIELFRV